MNHLNITVVTGFEGIVKYFWLGCYRISYHFWIEGVHIGELYM